MAYSYFHLSEPPINSQSSLSLSLFNFPLPENLAINPASLSRSLSEVNRPYSNNRPLAQTHLGPMASTSNSSSLSDSTARRKVRVRRAGLPMIRSGGFPAPRVLPSGMGFETLPPLGISFQPFQFLKSLGLKSVGVCHSILGGT